MSAEHKSGGGGGPAAEAANFLLLAAGEAATKFVDEEIPEMIDKPHGAHGH